MLNQWVCETSGHFSRPSRTGLIFSHLNSTLTKVSVCLNGKCKNLLPQDVIYTFMSQFGDESSEQTQSQGSTKVKDQCRGWCYHKLKNIPCFYKGKKKKTLSAKKYKMMIKRDLSQLLGRKPGAIKQSQGLQILLFSLFLRHGLYAKYFSLIPV